MANAPDPEVGDLQSFLEEMQGESDRASAILGLAYCDDRLKALLEAVLEGESANHLLDYPGALSSFGARVDVASALRLISEIERRDLKLLARIRNQFAHELDRSFETESIASQCRELRIPEERARIEVGDGSHITPRFRYELTSAVIGAILDWRWKKLKDKEMDRPFAGPLDQVPEVTSKGHSS